MMKNIFPKFRKSQGVTLAELLVAMFLASLLMLSIVSANIFIEKFISRWKAVNAIYQEGDFITSLIIKDLENSHDFRYRNPSVFTLLLVNKDSVIYKLDSSIVFRNGKSLNSPGMLCQNLSIKKNNFEKTNPDSILIKGTPKYSAAIATVKLELTFKGHNESFITSTRLTNDYWIY
jgi:hypothetical protein